MGISILKKMIVSQIAKIKMIEDGKGYVKFKASSLKLIPKEYVNYQIFLFKALEKLDGVIKTEICIEKNFIVVFYDERKTSKEKVLKWTEIVKGVFIDNYDFIETYGKDNLDYVVEEIEKKLDYEIDKLKI